jgi:biopolymer transport protein ExbB
VLSHLFLGLSLVGAEWVLYLLLILSVFSVSLMIERALFYRQASKGLKEFRSIVRKATQDGRLETAMQAAQSRVEKQSSGAQDLESQMALALLSSKGAKHTDVLLEVAGDPVLRARTEWEKNLSILATIGNNAPFVGLFGTVLGIIKAFHELSQQAGTGAQTVTAGVSEALVATAIGLLVAIPAVIAFNLFQRRVKKALAEAESLKSFLVGKIAV